MFLIMCSLVVSFASEAAPHYLPKACLQVDKAPKSFKRGDFERTLAKYEKAKARKDVNAALDLACRAYNKGRYEKGVSFAEIGTLALEVSEIFEATHDLREQLSWRVRSIEQKAKIEDVSKLEILEERLELLDFALSLRDMKRANALLREARRYLREMPDGLAAERARMSVLSGQLHILKYDQHIIGRSLSSSRESAIKEWQAAADFYKNQGNNITAAKLFVDIGSIYAWKKDYDLATAQFEGAKNLYAAGGGPEDSRFYQRVTGAEIMMLRGQGRDSEASDIFEEKLQPYLKKDQVWTHRVVSQRPPSYPRWAAEKGAEGWVLVGFNISNDGQVHGAFVLDSSPPYTFNEAARQAARNWKYVAVEGEGELTGLEVVMTFELER